MKKTKEKHLPVTTFVVLALLGEGQAHGYELERLVWNRGFRFWTDLGRSSIYNSLKLLEELKLIDAKIEAGGGPLRKVFSITKEGRQQLAIHGKKYLSNPLHPKSEIDLGVYILPFLTQQEALKAVAENLIHLKERKDFLQERLEWCEKRGLELPALAFERPLLVLEAEIQWLKKVEKQLKVSEPKNLKDWKEYVYKEPPQIDVKNAE